MEDLTSNYFQSYIGFIFLKGQDFVSIMGVQNKLSEWGWGALFLFSYFLVIVFMFRPELSRPIILALTSIPTIVVVFLTVSFNDELMDRLAGDAIDETLSEIDEKTGEEEFYWDQDTEIRNQIDELDSKAHQKVVMIVSGTLISATAPLVAWYRFGIQGLIAGIGLSIVVFYMLDYRPYFELQEIIRSSRKIYNANDEN